MITKIIIKNQNQSQAKNPTKLHMVTGRKPQLKKFIFVTSVIPKHSIDQSFDILK